MNQRSDFDFNAIRDSIIEDIESHAEWHEEVSRGKMFGFLVYEGEAQTSNLKSQTSNILKAYSGQILGRSDWEGYVPAIFDYLQPDGYFKTHEAEITLLNNRIREAEALLPKGKRTREVEAMKAERKERSQALQRWLFTQFRTTPSQPPPSGEETLNANYTSKIDQHQDRALPLKGGDGGGLSFLDIFTSYAQRTGSKQTVPPSGTGECCAPKLLHYANTHGLKALAVAEFWYGESPKGIIRHHGQFYEPCQAKCMPLLWYMLPEGCQVYPFMREQPSHDIQIIWQDEWFVAINKPAGLLSVPGKRNLPNAQDKLRSSQCTVHSSQLRDSSPNCQLSTANCQFLKPVHRLDMDTSGILLFAKTEEAFIKMQRMFAEKKTHSSSPLKGESSVHKEYVAIVQKSPFMALERGHSLGKSPFKGDLEGLLSLPLLPDFEHRPMQRVDYENGKEAITEYRFIGDDRVLLYPLTGRTHQLRIHCAHPDGLGCPILGDPLYGNTPAERMYLHASRLTFTHPFTGGTIEIVSEPPF
ncbi:MAG: RluA family pseudouridine synthase [Prevotella sp.]|nr:RluA family pseudouridine synthase [Prevotella sp.]